MATPFLPQTRAGKWSGYFLATFAVLYAIFFGLAASGQTGGEKFTDNLLLAIPGLGGDVAAVVAGLLGAFAVFRRGERSVTCYLAMGIGALLFVFLVGELLVPH
ncbi:MAG: hypothetical protein WC876_07160 [Candidatus Thermoplasmatota archaeon]|jgi:hypothetical protein